MVNEASGYCNSLMYATMSFLSCSLNMRSGSKDPGPSNHPEELIVVFGDVFQRLGGIVVEDGAVLLTPHSGEILNAFR